LNEELNMQNLKIPTAAEFQELAHDFQLSPRQAWFLEMAVKETLADIRNLQRAAARLPSRDERGQEVRDRIEFAALIGELVSFLEARRGFLERILPKEALQELGESSSFVWISRALGLDASPKDGDLLKDYLQGEVPFNIASAETFYARDREDYALRQGTRLLLYHLRIAREPNESWLAAKAANRGGRPAGFERRELITTLIEAAPDILGREAPMSVGGQFIELCERVLTLCGFDEKGIDKAVLAVLGDARSRSAVRAAPIHSAA
jgi:hypothetical protein